MKNAQCHLAAIMISHKIMSLPGKSTVHHLFSLPLLPPRLWQPLLFNVSSLAFLVVNHSVYALFRLTFSMKNMHWRFLHVLLCCSVTQSWLTLCDSMDCRTPGIPVHHQLLESTQTHVHRVGDAIQPSHPLSSPSPLAFYLLQHQGLFQWVSFCIRWPKYRSFSSSISPTNECLASPFLFNAK